jgi:S-disulfanyl-L-cysteine oxidoreductase SoxD
MSKRDTWCRRFGLVLALCFVGAGAAAAPYGFGQPASEAAIAAWNIDVDATGRGLPPGRGSVTQGQAVYSQKCAACHGANGEGKPADALVGGTGSLTGPKAVKTVGSYWPYATTLYDFIYRAMPYTAPQSLSPDEVYAVTAWLLNRNGIVPDDAVLDARSVPRVRMPNQSGFVQDTRPDTNNTACEHCR